MMALCGLFECILKATTSHLHVAILFLKLIQDICNVNDRLPSWLCRVISQQQTSSSREGEGSIRRASTQWQTGG